MRVIRIRNSMLGRHIQCHAPTPSKKKPKDKREKNEKSPSPNFQIMYRLGQSRKTGDTTNFRNV